MSRGARGDGFLDHELALTGELVEEGHGVEGKFGEEPDMEFVVGALLAGGKEGRGSGGEVGSAFGGGGEVGCAFAVGERGEVVGSGGFEKVFDRAEGRDFSGVEVIGGVFVGVLQFGAVEGFAEDSGCRKEGVIVKIGMRGGMFVGGDIFKVIEEVVLGGAFWVLCQSFGGDGAGDGEVFGWRELFFDDGAHEYGHGGFGGKRMGAHRSGWFDGFEFFGGSEGFLEVVEASAGAFEADAEGTAHFFELEFEIGGRERVVVGSGGRGFDDGDFLGAHEGEVIGGERLVGGIKRAAGSASTDREAEGRRL